MIKWPDIKFPPVNLYSLPRTSLPCMYIKLEKEYCRKEVEKFYDAIGTNQEHLARLNALNKRVEFNKLWNARAKG